MLETTKPRRADVVSPSRVKIPERIGIIGKTQGVSARSNPKPRKLSISQAKPPSAISPETRLPLPASRSEEHTSELQSLMRNSYAVFCLKKKKQQNNYKTESLN